MRKLLLSLLTVAAITSSSIAKENSLIPAGPKTQVILAKEGQSKAIISIPAENSSIENESAWKLKKYLEQITNAKFQIQKDKNKTSQTFISVGKTAMAKAAGFDKLKLGEEGIAVKILDGNIYLVGGTKGIMNAVMAFLEEDLGCRWYSDKWTYIPSDKNLTVAVTERVSIPDFSIRQIYSAHSLTNSPEWTRHNRILKWNHFNHVNGWFCHTYNKICPMKEFKSHPEFFAKDKSGKPFNTQICPTHPEIIKRAIARVKKALKANKSKNAVLISISENDGSTGFCRCKRCEVMNRKYQTSLAAHLTLVNEVARAIKDDFPNIKVDFLVYSKDLRSPPLNMKMEPNVALWFCSNNLKQYQAYRKNKKAVIEFKRWNKLVKTMNIWEYGCDYSNYFRVMPSLYGKADNLKFWKSQGVNGIFQLEPLGRKAGDQQALRAWILSKLMWNCQLDMDKLALDFCEGVFGKAAPEMYEYYQLVNKAGAADKTVEQFYGKAKFIAKANKIFAKAFAKAANNEDLRQRLENHYIPIAFMEINSIFEKYPRNRKNFPLKRYNALLEQIKKITKREDMKSYSELRSMSGRIAELELLKNAAKGGALGIYAINGTLYGYTRKKDPLAATGIAPCLPCNNNWLVQWQFPVNLCIPGQKYQLRAQLRPVNDSGTGKIASAGVHFKVTKQRSQAISNRKSFVVRLDAKKLSSKEYRWINIGKPFSPEKDCYGWFAAAAGSKIGGLFVDKIELVPVIK